MSEAAAVCSMSGRLRAVAVLIVASFPGQSQARCGFGCQQMLRQISPPPPPPLDKCTLHMHHPSSRVQLTGACMLRDRDGGASAGLGKDGGAKRYRISGARN